MEFMTVYGITKAIFIEVQFLCEKISCFGSVFHDVTMARHNIVTVVIRSSYFFIFQVQTSKVVTMSCSHSVCWPASPTQLAKSDRKKIGKLNSRFVNVALGWKWPSPFIVVN